jgi:hypothetical protein
MTSTALMSPPISRTLCNVRPVRLANALTRAALDVTADSRALVASVDSPDDARNFTMRRWVADSALSTGALRAGLYSWAMAVEASTAAARKADARSPGRMGEREMPGERGQIASFGRMSGHLC